MATFLALYRGKTIGEAEIIGVTNDHELVASVALGLLKNPTGNREIGDEAVKAVRKGRRRALKIISEEVGQSA